MKRNSDKKLKKFENKKRKITAFLDLINGNNNNKTDDVVIDTNSSDKKAHVFTTNSEEMSELRKKLATRLSKDRPKFFLEKHGIHAKVNLNAKNNCDEQSSPNLNCDDINKTANSVSIQDIQDFLIACLIPGPRLSSPPNWCKVYKPTKATKVAMFLFDCDYNNSDNGIFNSDCFQHIIKFDYNEDWIDGLLSVCLSNRQMQKLYLKSVKSKNTCSPKLCDSFDKEERISRTQLLLNPLQLVTEKYPLLSSNDISDYVTTKLKYSPVCGTSPLYGLDCEMCLTTEQILEVTRVSLVDENCELIYDTLVKPKNRIINYLTRYSGVTKKLLDPVTVTLDEVQQEIRKILPEDAILCGQSLNSDLHALKMIHPYIIDTSVIYNLSGIRQMKSSLKLLSLKFLQMDIQNDDKAGHDSCEDAIAAMKLVKLKLSMGVEFGDRVLQKKMDNGFDLAANMSLSSYLQQFETKLNVYYDHIDLDSNDKSLSIFGKVSKRNNNLIDAISRIINTDKAICIILDRNGYCFIKF